MKGKNRWRERGKRWRDKRYSKVTSNAGGSAKERWGA